MPGPNYHARTHLPGGTDPLPVAGDLQWAYASGDTGAAPSVVVYTFQFTGLYSNDSGFVEAAGVTSGRATWIQLNEPGYYILRSACYLTSIGFFDTADSYELVPVYNESGVGPIRITNATGVADSLGTLFGSPSNLLSADDNKRLGFWDTVTFNYDPDNPASDIEFASPLQIGLHLDSDPDDTTTRSIGAEMWLLRVAATPGFTDLSP